MCYVEREGLPGPDDDSFTRVNLHKPVTISEANPYKDSRFDDPRLEHPSWDVRDPAESIASGFNW
ncbi:hypothetical protein F441_15420 [Phytophthora nicotianae CJ01A1]|uniref:Uncharacterized protein n=3 Tax=Phytophthora nicotianae TaxID=4792 RepID=V9EHR8_PHYNI|nr:hypothetical protein F443_15603 [Phytophthora nicotianae P1569]ETP08621.1 hypothetical protein F441_15420 [Phytophthora nicotianae CJ01A1]ETP36658.1 hypothetical protein F442_15436 [Phytophthora nicotianae P10297]